MLAHFLQRLWLGGVSALNSIQNGISSSQHSLRDQISMKPRDILGRSVTVGNYCTLVVITLCYPILLYFRGLDWQLLGGMVFMYASFWVSVVLFLLIIQVLWLLNYCISQRFVENLLDFEIVERILGQDRSQDGGGDVDDETDSELEDGDELLDGRLRATG